MTSTGVTLVTLFVASALFTGLSVVLCVPLVIVGRPRGRTETIRRFLVGAVAIGITCGILSSTSERLTDQCKAAGNLACIDYGATGLQMLLIFGFGFAALLMAYLMYSK